MAQGNSKQLTSERLIREKYRELNRKYKLIFMPITSILFLVLLIFCLANKDMLSQTSKIIFTILFGLFLVSITTWFIIALRYYIKKEKEIEALKK